MFTAICSSRSLKCYLQFAPQDLHTTRCLAHVDLTATLVHFQTLIAFTNFATATFNYSSLCNRYVRTVV
jgi:hypothetical protein